jgi:hypothetical protein
MLELYKCETDNDAKRVGTATSISMPLSTLQLTQMPKMPAMAQRLVKNAPKAFRCHSICCEWQCVILYTPRAQTTEYLINESCRD